MTTISFGFELSTRFPVPPLAQRTFKKCCVVRLPRHFTCGTMCRAETCTVAAKLLGRVIHSHSQAASRIAANWGAGLSFFNLPLICFRSQSRKDWDQRENDLCSSLWQYQGLTFAPNGEMECCKNTFETGFPNSQTRDHSETYSTKRDYLVKLDFKHSVLEENTCRHKTIANNDNAGKRCK